MSSTALEAEALLRKIIPGSPFAKRTFIVGGYVRDKVIGILSEDLDLVVEKPGGAEELTKWLRQNYPENFSQPHSLGAGYPIWQVVFKGDCEIQIADTQSEAFPDPNTRQRVSVFGTLDEDCARRDFTVNMLYSDLTTGEILDPSGKGLEDIKSKILRGHPKVDLKKIFSDDPLRMVRLIRFHCKLGWAMPADVLESLKASKERLNILSVERIRDELIKMMLTGNFHVGLELMKEMEILAILLPEIAPMIGCTQDKIFHSEGDVWTHTLLVVKNAPPTVPLQLAALLHDAGKPQTREDHGERIKFIGHELFSADITKKMLTRLHFDSKTIKKVESLALNHMRGSNVESWATMKPARKLIRELGDDLPELIQLIEADSRSSFRADGSFHVEHVKKLEDAITHAQEIPLTPKSLLSGNEIMEILNIPAGREIAEVKDFIEQLQDEWAETGKVLTKEDVIPIVKKEFLTKKS